MKPRNLILIAGVVTTVPAALFIRRGVAIPRHHSLDPSELKSPAIATQGTAAVTAKEGLPGELIKKLFESGEAPKPTAEQLKAYVEKQKHSAASLLAAWQLGGEKEWLDEAAERYPDNPRVALAMLNTFTESNAADALPWRESLKRNDPGNAAGWCFDALDLLKNGAPDEARAALVEAARRGRLENYTMESSAALADAYRSAGYEGLQAEFLGLVQTPLPTLSLATSLQQEAMRRLGPDLDDGTVQDMLSIANLVRGPDEASFLINQLVGASVERRILDEFNTLELVPGTRKIVLERLAELHIEKTTIRDLSRKTAPLLSSADESELKQYFRRSKVEGEVKALQWLLARHPESK